MSRALRRMSPPARSVWHGSAPLPKKPSVRSAGHRDVMALAPGRPRIDTGRMTRWTLPLLAVLACKASPPPQRARSRGTPVYGVSGPEKGIEPARLVVPAVQDGRPGPALRRRAGCARRPFGGDRLVLDGRIRDHGLLAAVPR